MARSFLFSATDADVATTRLLALAAQTTGFMKGEPGAPLPGWYRPGGDNTEFMAQLHGALMATHAQAGPALWAVRLYTNVIWQPAYLAVIAGHLHGALPDLSLLTQRRRGIYVDGFRLPSGTQTAVIPEAGIALAGAHLAQLSAQLIAEINALVRLKPLPARRLLADRILRLMVWLSQKRPDLSPEQVLAYADLWLEALGVRGEGALEAKKTHDGRIVLIVLRKGCCLDYLITPDQLCSTCPRLGRSESVARQTANALAELS
jgi:siderophore ferric iron reductase